MDGLGELFPPLVDPELVARIRSVVAAEIAPRAQAIDREDVYPLECVRALAREGLSTLTLPRELGGEGATLAEQVAVFEEVAFASGAVGTSLITIFQAQTILRLYACASLQKAWLPRFREGLVASYALTEAGHGSDLHHLDTKAKRVGDEWVLDGKKAFVTSGSAADVFAILAETERGVSAFLVPRGTPGAECRVGPGCATWGLRNGPHVDLVLTGARLPLDHLVGEEGKGIREAATTLDHSRVLAAAISLGIARAAFEGALAFARDRVAFEKHVIDFQGIQWTFAENLTRIDAARLLTYEAARTIARGGEAARIAAEAKLLASMLATDVALHAIQVCGAQGVREDLPFGRYLRDAKSYEIAGGSSEILRNTIGKFLARPNPTNAVK